MVGHDDNEAGQTLTCVDCKAPFPFSDGELRFFQSKGLSIPKRCKACRILKKAKRAEQEGGNVQGDHHFQSGTTVGDMARNTDSDIA